MPQAAVKIVIHMGKTQTRFGREVQWRPIFKLKEKWIAGASLAVQIALRSPRFDGGRR
jgi:hypothetical protein